MVLILAAELKMHFIKIKRMSAVVLASVTCLSVFAPITALAGELHASSGIAGLVKPLGISSTFNVPYVEQLGDESSSDGGMSQPKKISFTSGVSCVIPIYAKAGYLSFDVLYDSDATDPLRLRIYSDAECQTTPLDEVTGSKVDIAEDYRGEAMIGAHLPTEGTYYVSIDAPANTTSSTYIVTYSAMVNPILSAAESLELNADNLYYNANNLKTTYYKITLPSAGALRVFEMWENTKDMDLETDDSSGSASCQILNSKKAAIPNYNATSDEYPTAILNKGTYYLKMSGMKYSEEVSTDFKSYKVSSGGTSKSSAITATNAVRKYSALKLTGQISGSSWFKFKVGSEQRDKLSLANVAGDMALKYTIYNGKKAIKSGTVGELASKTITFSPSSKTWKKGTYYIRFYKPSKIASSIVSLKRTATH